MQSLSQYIAYIKYQAARARHIEDKEKSLKAFFSAAEVGLLCLPSMVPIANDVGSVSEILGSMASSKSELDSGAVVVEKSSSKLNVVVVEGTVEDVVAPVVSVPLPIRAEVSELSNATETVELVLVV